MTGIDRHAGEQAVVAAAIYLPDALTELTAIGVTLTTITEPVLARIYAAATIAAEEHPDHHQHHHGNRPCHDCGRFLTDVAQLLVDHGHATSQRGATITLLSLNPGDWWWWATQLVDADARAPIRTALIGAIEALNHGRDPQRIITELVGRLAS